MSSAFNARLVSTWTPDRLYRIYIGRDEMFFIRIGGQAGVAQGVASQFGLLGAILLKAHRKRSAGKTAAKAAELDQHPPSLHLAAHKHNFHASVTAVERSVLEPPARMGAHGEHVGRWRLKMRDAKERLFQFETVEDMMAAQQLLFALGSLHASHVAWDPIKKRFTARAA